MKKDLQSIPVPLQHQLLIQTALAAFCIVVAVVTWIFFAITAAIPFFCGLVLLAMNVIRLYYIAVTGAYLELSSTVLKVERTPIRQRARAMLLEIDGKALRVTLRNRHISIQAGDSVVLYIRDTTPLYEWRGIHQLHSYLALTKEKQGTAV